MDDQLNMTLHSGSLTIDEAARLGLLYETQLLDSEVEEDFDQFTKLAASILRVPVALISLVDADRQFFKSHVGLSEPWATARQTPLSHSFCQHVVTDNAPFVVSDARQHPRVCDNLAIPDLGVVAYMGMPLRLPEGPALGALCVIEGTPRVWSEQEAQQLEALARLVTDQIVLRRSVAELSAIRVELQQDKACFRAALDNSRHGICFFDAEDRLVTANARYAELLRLPFDELADGIQLSTIQQLRASAGTNVIAQSEHLSAGLMRTEKLLADGRSLAMHRTMLPAGGWIGTVEDITEQKASEVALRDSERRFRLLADNSNDVIILGHVDGRRTYYSPAVEKLTGYTPDEALSISMAEWVHPDDRAALFAATRSLSSTKPSVVVMHRLRCKEGHYVWIESSFSLVNDGSEHAVIVANIRDVTLRRVAEAEYRNLFERTVVGVYRRTLDGVLIRANPALARMREFESESELLSADRAGRSHWQMDPQRKAERTALVMAHGSIRDFVSTLTHRVTKEQRTISETAWVVNDDDGKALYIEGLVVDVTEETRARQAIEHHVRHDHLTGLLNRKGLEEAYRNAAGSSDEHVIALYADLDGFKSINDTLGHRAGDHLLTGVASRMRQVLGEHAQIGRLGGDEFVAILRGPRAANMAEQYAVQLIVGLQHPIEAADGRFVTVGVSIGLASARREVGLDELLGLADAAMYQAKRDGRNAYRWYTHALTDVERERRELIIDVREACANNQIEAWFQPIHHLTSGACIGFEALIRWNHPKRGLLGPGAFLDHVEECGLIVPFGEAVLRQALVLARQLPAHMKLAVNMSARQLSHPAVVNVIADTLAHAGVSASRLEIEVTENVFIGQNDAQWHTLEKLRKLGISIALDDFGTGWSSLGYISRFNFNRLKIDKTFIQKCSSSREKTILEVIIDMGHRLGMALTAEGLEQADHVNLMRELGCQHGQGYLFAKPMSSRDALTYALRGQRPEQMQALIAG